LGHSTWSSCATCASPVWSMVMVKYGSEPASLCTAASLHAMGEIRVSCGQSTLGVSPLLEIAVGRSGSVADRAFQLKY